MNWRRRAACRDLGSDLFFPVGTSGKTLERDLTRAFAVCADCPVRTDCAAERPIGGAGVWAGVFYTDRGRPHTTPPAPGAAAAPEGSVAELVAAVTSVDSNPYRHKAGATTA